MTAFSYSVFAQGGPVMWLLMALGVAALVCSPSGHFICIAARSVPWNS